MDSQMSNFLCHRSGRVQKRLVQLWFKTIPSWIIIMFIFFFAHLIFYFSIGSITSIFRDPSAALISSHSFFDSIFSIYQTQLYSVPIQYKYPPIYSQALNSSQSQRNSHRSNILFIPPSFLTPSEVPSRSYPLQKIAYTSYVSFYPTTSLYTAIPKKYLFSLDLLQDPEQNQECHRPPYSLLQYVCKSQ